jgi:RimJ/RimL family protein N-acetyltransferase
MHPSSPRLIFAPHRLADFDEFAAMWADPEITRFIGGAPSTAEESWARLLRNAGQWAMLGYGPWVLRDRTTGRLVGDVGFKQFRRGLDPAWEALPELGWVLCSQAWGQGLATEAVQAALAWADARFGWAETICMIQPENSASRRVAEKCGFIQIATVVYHGKAALILTRRQAGSASF